MVLYFFICKVLKFDKHALKRRQTKTWMLFLGWQNCFLLIREGLFFKFLRSLSSNIVELLGCFIVEVQTTKMINFNIWSITWCTVAICNSQTSHFVIKSSQFVITTAFCNKKPDAFCNKIAFASTVINFHNESSMKP